MICTAVEMQGIVNERGRRQVTRESRGDCVQLRRLVWQLPIYNFNNEKAGVTAEPNHIRQLSNPFNSLVFALITAANDHGPFFVLAALHLHLLFSTLCLCGPKLPNRLGGHRPTFNRCTMLSLYRSCPISCSSPSPRLSPAHVSRQSV